MLPTKKGPVYYLYFYTSLTTGYFHFWAQSPSKPYKFSQGHYLHQCCGSGSEFSFPSGSGSRKEKN